MTEENNVPAEQEFDLDSAFDQAFDKASNPNKFMEEVAPKPEKKEELSESIKAEEEKEDEPEAEDEPVVEIKEKPSSKKADAELKVAFEKLEKSYKDTQKAFHEDRKKLSAYKRAIKSFVDEGTLTDDEAQTLLDHVHFESSPDLEEPTPSSNNGSGLAKYAKTIDKELQIMRKYSSNPEEIEINTQAFQHLFDTSSWQEKKNILDELSGFEDDDVELTKQMLLLGAQHNNEVYSEIHESGGVKQLKEKYIYEIETLKKELDKSKKQYVKLKEKYEDYNEPTVIASPGGSSTASSSKSDAIDIDAALDYAFRGK
jgi:hypothetical protein